MSITEIDGAMRDQIRDVVAEVLKVDVAEITWNSNFREEHGADSLNMVDILIGLEVKLGITLEQEVLTRMTDVASTYDVIADALRNQ